MIAALRARAPAWVRRAGARASNLGWAAAWRAARVVATPWMQRELAAARARVVVRSDAPTVIDRAALDGWLRDAAPPDVPFDVRVVPVAELRARFPDSPAVRRGRHLVGTYRMTHRELPGEAIAVVAMYSDVAADYFIETVTADVAHAINDAHGADVACADGEAGVAVVLKEIATAAGMGRIGKNSLFFSDRFGFNCKLGVVLLAAPVSRYDPVPVGTAWKLPDCTTCNLCVEACPVEAFDDYTMVRAAACDRVIAADYFGSRRDHMCRACITRCPVSNDVLKLRRSEGAPQRTFWDNEAQLSLAADLFAYRPAFWVWLLQRFYYGAPIPGRPARARRGFAEALKSAVSTATTDRTRDGWRLAARRRPR